MQASRLLVGIFNYEMQAGTPTLQKTKSTMQAGTPALQKGGVDNLSAETTKIVRLMMKNSNEIKPAIPEFQNPKDLPFASIQYRGQLPHLYKEGGTYFVTFRLFDAVATKTSDGIKDQIENLLTPDEIGERSEPPLQQGSCILREEPIAKIVQDAMLYFHDFRYYLHAWCIMPNHVHVVVSPYDEYQLSGILHTWKSYTAHKINKYLRSSGVIWEKESFDHLVRSIDLLEQFVHYTENNPVQARLCNLPEEWFFSSKSKNCSAGFPPAK